MPTTQCNRSAESRVFNKGHFPRKLGKSKAEVISPEVNQLHSSQQGILAGRFRVTEVQQTPEALRQVYQVDRTLRCAAKSEEFLTRLYLFFFAVRTSFYVWGCSAYDLNLCLRKKRTRILSVQLRYRATSRHLSPVVSSQAPDVNPGLKFK